MKTQKIRTIQEVREEFRRKGKSVASWARDNGFPVATVNQVLTGRNAATFGVGHKIAVKLGIKDGEIEDGDCAPCEPGVRNPKRKQPTIAHLGKS